MASFPTTAAPTLSSWQWSYRGLTFGPSQPYSVTTVDGFGMPAVQTGDVQRPRDMGDFSGFDLLSGRDLTLQGDIVSDGTSLQHAISVLAQATTVTTDTTQTEYPMWVAYPNVGTIATMVRPRKRDLPLDLGHVSGLATYALQFRATDPRWYSAATTASRTNLGAVTVTNSGNYETRPVITVNGPISSGWTISNGTKTLTVNLALTSGQSLAIDLDTRTAQMTGGTATNVRYALGATPAWFTCGPGSTTITLGGAGASSSTTLSVQYASAWVF